MIDNVDQYSCICKFLPKQDSTPLLSHSLLPTLLKHFRLTAKGRRLVEAAIPAWGRERRVSKLLGKEGLAFCERDNVIEMPPPSSEFALRNRKN
jgi:hypothetical protein